MRRPALAVLALAGTLVAASPASAAWHTLATGVSNTVVPSMIVTKSGTELVSFESPVAGTISVARAGGAAHTIVTGDPIAGQTQLVQLPDGSIQLYFPNGSGVARMTSTNDGVSWTGPVQTESHDVGGVVGATVGPDGTPYFVQNGTGFVNVFKGLNGETVRNVFAQCCGYGSQIAVDSAGVVRVAFYSNANNSGEFDVEQLGSDLTPGLTYGITPTAPRDDRVPLVSDAAGYTYLGWSPGYPEAAAFSVVRFQGNETPEIERKMFFAGSFTGGDPHMALSVDPSDRLWAAWTGQGGVHVTRSRTHAAHTGALVSAKVNGTAYDLSAVGLPGKVGAIDVVLNTGSSLVEQQLKPGLGVRAFHKVTTVGTGKKKHSVVLHYVQALDDLTPVGGAIFKIGGHTYHANAQGIATVKAGHGKASAAGYVGASFRTR